MKRAVLLAILSSATPAAAAEPATVQDKLVAYGKIEAGRHVQEVPAQSNTGRAIRRYHTAVKHARETEPWCAIFVSYVAKRAGYPLGSVGQGIWDVQNLFKWGRKEGFYFANGARRVKRGDIAVHGYGHAGIVARVTKDGRIFTIDGNWGHTVRYQPLPYLSVSGYVRLPSTSRAD